MSTPPPSTFRFRGIIFADELIAQFERPPGLKPKMFATIAVWIICVSALAFALVQMQSYAAVINNAGVIRGGTQQSVKLALADQPNNTIVARVNGLLDKLQSEENARFIKDPASQDFLDDIGIVEGTWKLINQEFVALANGTGSKEHLLALSEDHFKQADAMVLSAQRRAERDLMWTIVGCLILVVAVTSTMAIREHRYQRARQAAMETDPLTGGYNLTGFERHAHDLVQMTKPRTYLIAYSNVENFRVINESFGRPAGDEAIRTINTLMERACKRGELVGHANADHFALLLRNTEGRAEQMAAQMQACLKADDDLPFSDRITCGYGIYELSERAEDIAVAVSNAGAVLKEGVGTDLLARYNDAFRSKLAFEQSVVRHMADAIEREEFVPYLQSQTSLIDGTIVGAELLCRWDSPDLGFLSPDRFIPQFERNGFINELDFYMLEQACRRYQDLDVEGQKPIHLAVNISRVSMLQNDFEERFVSLVERYGMPPERLHVEVTEGVFSVDEDTVLNILEDLQQRGFPIAMDDFGTGYSSLSLLRKMPIDVLKIDRGFLSASEDDERSRQVLESVINLAKSLGISTVCEGLETQEQVMLLHNLGCEIAQGFFFARPIPFDELVEQLHAR